VVRPASAELATLAAQLDEVKASLEASRERERALEVGRRELIAAMSHDLRSPLAAIRALAEGLEDGVIDDPKDALSQLRANVSRMTGMVDDLLELSRLQGPRDRPFSLVSMREVVEDVAAEARPYAASRGVNVEVAAPERLPVRGDGDDLVRAVSNLVGNAVRHTVSGSTVRVQGMHDSVSTVGVEVIDHCGGIPEAHLERLFDIGWRGDPERSPGAGSGAGLGLAIVRGVVEAHGGTVGVRNDNGGCRFTLALPAAAPEP
jgi:signal transduction histidine kinase